MTERFEGPFTDIEIQKLEARKNKALRRGEPLGPRREEGEYMPASPAKAALLADARSVINDPRTRAFSIAKGVVSHILEEELSSQITSPTKRIIMLASVGLTVSLIGCVVFAVQGAGIALLLPVIGIGFFGGTIARVFDQYRRPPQKKA